MPFLIIIQETPFADKSTEFITDQETAIERIAELKNLSIYKIEFYSVQLITTTEKQFVQSHFNK